MLGGRTNVAHAQENISVEIQSTEVTFTNNLSANSYGRSRYDYCASTIKSYLIPNGDGTLTRLEYADGTILLENYDTELNLIGNSSMPMELSVFGGFFQGEQYNWIVFGQENPNSSDDTEVFRIVKYSKSWERLGDCRLTGHNTTIPFDAGNCRLAEYGGNLFVRTSHEMYSGHQADVMLEVNEQTMELTSYVTDMSSNDYGYVSHSFDQFVDTTDGQLTAVDLGDKYPRGIIWFQYPKGADHTQALNGMVTQSTVLAIPEADPGDPYAYNATGVSIGGYQVSRDHYMVAYNSVDQSSSANQVSSSAPRNIYLAAASRKRLRAGWNTVQITDCIEGQQALTPQLVKVADDKYLLLWEYVVDNSINHNSYNFYNRYSHYVQYCLVNGAGQKLTQTYTWNSTDGARISDCVPVVWNGKVVWYASCDDPYYDYKELRFCMIDYNSIPVVTPTPDQSSTEIDIDMDADTSKYYNINTNGGTWDGTHYYLPDWQMVRNAFFCDGTYTYYLQADGTPMIERLTYHPDGEHIIYFDSNGHEVFNDFADIKKSIAGDDVDDRCFFNALGYMYVDTLTYDKTGTDLYYINAYGVLERNGWFQFSGHEFDAGLGFSGTPGGWGRANYGTGSLWVNTVAYLPDGTWVYLQGDGHVRQ